MSSKKLTATALAAALICVVTITVRLPIPALSGGYINLGDAALYLLAAVLGGLPVALAAAVGSALTDLLVGAAIYAPATFIIKFLMGLIAGGLAWRRKFPRFALAAVLGGVVMVAGYFLYEALVFGRAYALASAPFNLIQAGVCAALACALFPAIRKIDLKGWQR